MTLRLRPGGLLPILFLAAILAADLAACFLGERLLAALGLIAGLELGLLIFLNLLGLLLVLDLLAEKFSLPGWRWFRRLEVRPPATEGSPAAGGEGETPPRDEPGEPGRLEVEPPAGPARGGLPGAFLLSVQVLGLALLFYVLEAFLLPFLPVAAGIQYEVALVGTVFIWRLLPPLQVFRSGSQS